jgi:cytochrome c5
MRSARAAAAAVVALVAAFALVATVPAKERAPARIYVYPARLPEGDGRPIAERACLLCHSVQLIAQQAKDSTAWEKTLVLMAKWGAPVDSLERDTLRAYLVRTLGPRPARQL